ncbi:hypothetical protein [Myroides marinus]|uniref:hypothetical protein n=1 Tax=Myroides marinus TaxID=703342 RepID=UPI0025755F61|nr:hypothetical protein [Myroides marinus]MDM1376349.1 hypothetical protein [Myroides marinus]MDM1382057.1 hypothetical protein [Myroides marinus]
MNDLFATLYEGFNPLNLFYIENFSSDMYDSGSYSTMGWLLLIVTVVMVALYYFLLSNYGKFYKRIWWFVYILVIALINFIIAYNISMNAMEDLFLTNEDGNPYGFSEYFQLGMVNVLYGVILSIVFSIIMKFKSIQATRTPF